MKPQVFKMSGANAHVIEPVIRDGNIHYMHMVLLPGEALPAHETNANVYMTVAGGTLTISLEGGEPVSADRGTVLKIPRGVRMAAENNSNDKLELFVVKAPAPDNNK